MPKQVYKMFDRKTVGQSHIYLDQLPREANGIYNMAFDTNGRLVKRTGYTKYNTTSLSASHPITGLYRFYKLDTSSKFTLVVCDTILYKLANTDPWAGTSIKTGLTSEADMYFDSFYNRCYFCNDEDGLFKFGKTDSVVRTTGITAPAAAPTGVATTGGSLGTGIYKFRYTYVDEDGYESNPSPISDEIITESAVIEDCDSIWNESNDPECTVSVDTVNYTKGYYEGDVGGSAKFVITDDAEANDILATEDISSTDLSGSLSIKLWIRCSMATSAGDLQILLDDDVNCVSPLESLDVPALTADVWTECTLTLANPSSDTAIISIGLKYVTDLGACTIHIDDIRDVKAAPNNKITLTIVNSDDAKVVSKNIYRTAVGGAIYYYDGEVDDNTTTTYTSTKADGTLGTQVSTQHDTAPTSPQLVIKRGNRLYLGDDDNLCISALSDVEYFPAAWFLKTTDRRKITGIIEQMRNLIVFTEDVINVLSGTDEYNFVFRKSYAGDGCIATRSIQNISNYIIFLSFNGLMAFNGQEIAEIDEKLSKYLRGNINYAYADTSCSCYYDDKYILSYPKGSATYPTESVYFDYKTGKTGVYSFAFNVFSRWDKGSDGILIKAGSTTIGRVYNLFAGLDDDGSNIEFYDRIMSLDFALPEVEKNYYDFYIKVKTTTGTALRFYYTIDDNAETYIDKTLTADKERWYRLRLPSSTRGRSIAIRPRMNDKYQAEFQGYIIVYDTEALRV